MWTSYSPIKCWLNERRSGTKESRSSSPASSGGVSIAFINSSTNASFNWSAKKEQKEEEKKKKKHKEEEEEKKKRRNRRGRKRRRRGRRRKRRRKRRRRRRRKRIQFVGFIICKFKKTYKITSQSLLCMVMVPYSRA